MIVVVPAAPHDAHFIGVLPDLGQQLANSHARHVGIDGLVFAADFLGRIRLGVEAVVMR